MNLDGLAIDVYESLCKLTLNRNKLEGVPFLVGKKDILLREKKIVLF
jgi:hypothetical protein